MPFKTKNRGFTLVETLVGVFVFLVISLGIYQGFFSGGKVVTLGKLKTEAALLANEQFELVHNLSYGSVGLIGGVPAGLLPRVQTFVRSGVTFIATTTIRNIDDPFDGTIGGTPNDTAPADYKEVNLTISCTACVLTTPLVFSTTVSPKNLENSSTNGAIFISVIDADGQPVPQATVHVQNDIAVPSISIDETTDNNGKLQLVDVPPGANAYQVTVTKAGYSTDKTYPITVDNPNPTQPHLTVAASTVTSATFSIDQVGDLALSTINTTCTPVASVGLTLTGKVIGTNPTVYKYSQNVATDSNGLLSVTGLEWDAYDLQLLGTTYDLAGTAPFVPVTLSPGATQNVSVVVVPRVSKALLVIVKDAVTGLPQSGAAVKLQRSTSYNVTQTTDQGSFSQTDWSGGTGQTNFTDTTKYHSDDGHLNVTSSAGDVTLKKTGSNYASSGYLISSIFDTGSASTTYYSITWNPQSQPSQTGSNSLKFQVATAATSTATTTWTYLGPDGTAGSYYTTTNGNIAAANDNQRFVRYKAYLSTSNTSKTPTLSDVALTYGNGCLPFGQVLFNALSSGTYKVTVTETGYQTYTNSNIPVTSNWQKVVIPLQPS